MMQIMNYLLLGIITFASSLAISVIVMPFVRKLGIRIGWIAQLRKDRWNSRPVPILGGVGIFIAFGGALLINVIQNGAILKDTWHILSCAALMFFLGIFDDIKKIKPPTKLIWQLITSTIILLVGNLRIDFFPWPITNILLTYLWLVGITNAINLLDNMDGLAGGVAVISSLILGYFYWVGEQYDFMIVTISLAGAVLGFLIFNFPPAKIFMGNSGSMLLGFSLASLALGRQSQASNVFASLGVPTLIMLLPILDTTFVVITRLIRGQSPIRGGTDHTSHRMFAFGLSERQTVLTLYGVALISGMAAAGLETLDYDLSLVIIPLLLIFLALVTAHLGRVRVVLSQEEGRDPEGSANGVRPYQRRLFEILLDLVIIGFSYYLAYWTRYGLDMTAISMDLFMKSWPIALVAAYIMFFIFRVYRGVWEYLGSNDLLRYAGASFGTGGVAYIILNIIYPESAFDADIFIVFTLFTLIGLVGTRLSFQVLDQFYRRQLSRRGKNRVLIYGADDAGVFVLSWILRNSQLGYTPVIFFDERPQYSGRYINDMKVTGDIKQCRRMMEGEGIQGVIFSSQAQLDTSQGLEMLALCKETGVWVRVLHFELEDVDALNR